MTLNKSILIILCVLIIDQLSKVYIKLHFPLTLYGDASLLDWGWFKILFIENKGMAWGAKISDFIPIISEKSGKLILTLFRILAVPLIFYWLYDSIKKKETKLLIISISLVLAGAIGNLIDSVFYGFLFTDSYLNVAVFSPGNGYESVFYGHVVDMLQFPMFTWNWPSWIPYIGGESFTFFEPVFNIADTAISTGVGIMIVFNKKVFP
ncbi:MAG: lipoprotein signal peptidase [Flavobacteriaceae bacterium]|jgi:signal peptidase II|nr:lipoprotein signal peptidase [Flavobacteriaceae bacterium]MBT6448988.1 lipoprotein signal peptidase [Flavobacteriaceae bacterium]MBT7623935.1 lipoprotein signal peptidase [Flavobacteriaceae bacterium]